MSKPVVKLIGQDGNVFMIIGLTNRALKQAGLEAEAKEFVYKAYSASSYSEVLQLVTQYCSIR